MEVRSVNLVALEQPFEALRARQPRQEARLLLSLQTAGQKNPLVVIAGRAVGAYAVVDGHKRLRALKVLKADVAEAELWSLSAEEALVRTYRLQQGAWNALEEAALIEELHRGAKWSLRKIAEELNRTEGWASRRLGLMEDLPRVALEAVQQGKVGVYSAVKYLLPLARAKPDLAERLAAKLGAGFFTTRQVGLLYEHCMKGSKEVAERIVADPTTFLKAFAIPKGDVRLSDPQNKCLERLNTMGRVALSLVRDLPEVWPAPSDTLASEVFAATWRKCRDRLAYLEKTVVQQEGTTPEAAHA